MGLFKSLNTTQDDTKRGKQKVNGESYTNYYRSYRAIIQNTISWNTFTQTRRPINSKRKLNRRRRGRRRRTASTKQSSTSFVSLDDFAQKLGNFRSNRVSLSLKKFLVERNTNIVSPVKVLFPRKKQKRDPRSLKNAPLMAKFSWNPKSRKFRTKDERKKRRRRGRRGKAPNSLTKRKKIWEEIAEERRKDSP